MSFSRAITSGARLVYIITRSYLEWTGAKRNRNSLCSEHKPYCETFLLYLITRFFLCGEFQNFLLLDFEFFRDSSDILLEIVPYLVFGFKLGRGVMSGDM
ncbi:hypothetical protein GDO81_018577 [Engystomops pustulosus]|uniref:Uncharacterized protein n=1 Tax=Engystomops pustulosus TaxID=76066 RepID=A0AAV6ZGK4_ENGPU|nr:hypothetical protein GDO81_018577 [Engystomops pustulosus]